MTKLSDTGPEVAVLKELYAALNRNDIPQVLKFFDPQSDRIEFEGSPSGGAYHGLEEIKAHFSKGRDTWAEGGCEPERFVTTGDKVVVFCHVKVKLKSNQQWVEGNTGDVFTFRNGKITEMRTFFGVQEALKWAGVDR